MVTEVILPKLGQTMEEGTIVEWLKQEGDLVERGEALFTMESDKATLEVEAPKKGFLRKIIAPAGETVSVLSVVALITRSLDEDISTYEARLQAASVPANLNLETSRPVSGRIFASPRARKAAREGGVDLALLAGSGPNGRIVERDVLAYLEERPKATPVALRAAAAAGVDVATVPGSGVSGRVMKRDVLAAAPVGEPVAETVPLAGPRRVIAERMATSAQTTARVTLVTEVDATTLVEVREKLKATVADEWGFAPGHSDLLGIITARALREFPYMNARLSADGEAIERLPFVNLGMAVDTERGLLVPVVRGADRLGLRAFGTEFRTLVERARSSKSLPDDLSGGTFTVTNLGMYGVDEFTPIINLPEAAILGVGRIQAKPVVRDGQVVVREMLTLSLSFDHRLVDGAPAARFLQRIAQLVEEPYLLLS
jgi:pyruvate dehydrogenase E2 component (dihydrolipoamide acetyltransferase)